MCKCVYEYDDDLKLFKEWYIRQIPYFKNLSNEMIHNVVFSFHSETYEKGHKLLGEEDLTDKIVLVLYGIIDIETTGKPA